MGSTVLPLVQTHGGQQRFIDAPCDGQPIIPLIIRDCTAGRGADDSIRITAGIAPYRQPPLHLLHNRTSGGVGMGIVSRLVAAINNQPPAIIPAVAMVAPHMHIVSIPIAMPVSMDPKPTVVVTPRVGAMIRVVITAAIRVSRRAARWRISRTLHTADILRLILHRTSSVALRIPLLHIHTLGAPLPTLGASDRRGSPGLLNRLLPIVRVTIPPLPFFLLILVLRRCGHWLKQSEAKGYR